MPGGRIVLLNGASSAGKTSLAQALAAQLPTPWLVMPVDLFHGVRSRPPQEVLSEAEWQETFRRTRSAYHRALAGSAAAGCDVIGDHVLSEPWRLEELLGLTRDIDVLLVHVTCDRDELERREGHRGDRQVGTASAQAELVFRHDDCDLEVDTTRGTPEQCAALVAELIASPPADTAFDRLRRGRRERPGPSVVYVSGIPGSGKTTLARPLAESLGLPLVTKDVIKEALFEALPPTTEEALAWSRTLGAAAMELLYELADQPTAVMLEANFWPRSEVGRARLLDLERQLVEVHCSCPPELAARRYVERAAAGSRHAGAHPLTTLTPESLAEFDGPVGLGELVLVDTSREVDVADVAAQVRSLI